MHSFSNLHTLWAHSGLPQWTSPLLVLHSQPWVKPDPQTLVQLCCESYEFPIGEPGSLKPVQSCYGNHVLPTLVEPGVTLLSEPMHSQPWLNQVCKNRCNPVKGNHVLSPLQDLINVVQPRVGMALVLLTGLHYYFRHHCERGKRGL